MTQSDLRQGTLRSSVVTVTAGRLRMNESGDRLVPIKLDAPGEAERKKFTEAQRGVAKDLESKAGELKNPFTGEGLSDAERIAAECIVQEWESSLAALQGEAIAKDGVGSKSSPPGSKKAQQNATEAYNRRHRGSKTTWGDMTPEQRRRAVEYRQQDLAAKNTDGNPFAGSKNGPGPTKSDCREYQANWLWQQQEAGNIPPMQGKAPGTAAPDNLDPDQGKENEVKL